jgi:hypothetical protein
MCARRSLSAVLLLFTALSVPEGAGTAQAGKIRTLRMTIDDDIEYPREFYEMWNKRLIPGIIPLRKEIESDNPPAL